MNNILYKGVNIYYMDFSNLRTEKIIFEKMEEFIKYIISQPESSVYALTNLQNMYFNKIIFQRFKEFVIKDKPFIKKSAIIGLDGLIKVMFNGIVKTTKRDLHAFNSIEEAKEFLVN